MSKDKVQSTGDEAVKAAQEAAAAQAGVGPNGIRVQQGEAIPVPSMDSEELRDLAEQHQQIEAGGEHVDQPMQILHGIEKRATLKEEEVEDAEPADDQESDQTEAKIEVVEPIDVYDLEDIDWSEGVTNPVEYKDVEVSIAGEGGEHGYEDWFLVVVEPPHLNKPPVVVPYPITTETMRQFERYPADLDLKDLQRSLSDTLEMKGVVNSEIFRLGEEGSQGPYVLRISTLTEPCGVSSSGPAFQDYVMSEPLLRAVTYIRDQRSEDAACRVIESGPARQFAPPPEWLFPLPLVVFSTIDPVTQHKIKTPISELEMIHALGQIEHEIDGWWGKSSDPVFAALVADVKLEEVQAVRDNILNRNAELKDTMDGLLGFGPTMDWVLGPIATALGVYGVAYGFHGMSTSWSVANAHVGTDLVSVWEFLVRTRYGGIRSIPENFRTVMRANHLARAQNESAFRAQVDVRTHAQTAEARARIDRAVNEKLDAEEAAKKSRDKKGDPDSDKKGPNDDDDLPPGGGGSGSVFDRQLSGASGEQRRLTTDPDATPEGSRLPEFPGHDVPESDQPDWVDEAGKELPGLMDDWGRHGAEFSALPGGQMTLPSTGLKLPGFEMPTFATTPEGFSMQVPSRPTVMARTIEPTNGAAVDELMAGVRPPKYTVKAPDAKATAPRGTGSGLKLGPMGMAGIFTAGFLWRERHFAKNHVPMEERNRWYTFDMYAMGGAAGILAYVQPASALGLTGGVVGGAVGQDIAPEVADQVDVLSHVLTGEGLSAENRDFVEGSTPYVTGLAGATPGLLKTGSMLYGAAKAGTVVTLPEVLPALGPYAAVPAAGFGVYTRGKEFNREIRHAAVAVSTFKEFEAQATPEDLELFAELKNLLIYYLLQDNDSNWEGMLGNAPDALTRTRLKAALRAVKAPKYARVVAMAGPVLRNDTLVACSRMYFDEVSYLDKSLWEMLTGNDAERRALNRLEMGDLFNELAAYLENPPQPDTGYVSVQ